jgi:hypothetical protein
VRVVCRGIPGRSVVRRRLLGEFLNVLTFGGSGLRDEGNPLGKTSKSCILGVLKSSSTTNNMLVQFEGVTV